MSLLEGVAVANVTPFKDNGGIDTGYIYKQLQFLAEKGAQGVVPAGSNGEFPSLTLSEKKQVYAAAAGAKGNMYMIAGIGACNIPEAIELADYAAGVGADAVLSTPPFYYTDVDDQGLYDYYQPLLDRIEIPLFLYNIPQYSGIVVSDTLIDMLLAHPGLAGIKDSGGNLERTIELIGRYPGLKVFGGSDSQVGEALTAGATGVISGVGNFLPELLRDAWEASLVDLGLEDASAKVRTARQIIQSYPWIAATKHCLKLRGMPETGIRPPLSDLSDAQKTELTGRVKEDFSDFFGNIS